MLTKSLSPDPDKMMEMDRLVVVLDGSEDQNLVVESKHSHATMKEDEGDGLEKYENIIYCISRI